MTNQEALQRKAWEYLINAEFTTVKKRKSSNKFNSKPLSKSVLLSNNPLKISKTEDSTTQENKKVSLNLQKHKKRTKQAPTSIISPKKSPKINSLFMTQNSPKTPSTSSPNSCFFYKPSSRVSKVRRSLPVPSLFSKTQSQLKSLISSCTSVQALPPKSPRISTSLALESIRHRNLSITRSVLESLSHLEAKFLKKSYEWSMLSAQTQKTVEDQAAREYRYSIMDPNRTAALYERTKSIYKLLMSLQRKGQNVSQDAFE